MLTDFSSLVLTTTHVQLETLTEKHRRELYGAAQDHTIWRYTLTTAFGTQFNEWFDKALHALMKGEQLPFIVRRLEDGKLVGSTRYYLINYIHKHLSIGYTWYIPEVWGTYVNPSCKYLLLKYAFENLQMNRVEFMTDTRNERSRAALTKLGATEEGILRQNMIVHHGSIRDSYIFSIIKPEWPTIKENLETRIEESIMQQEGEFET